MEIKNKRIIVTGAANGIGKELTKQLLERGAFVYGLDISEEGLKQLEKELNTDKLKTYKIDMSNKKEIEKFHDKYMEENEKLDILINNAGIVQPFIKVIDLEDEIIERVMNVNFYGPLHLTRSFLKDLVGNKNGGFIANVSSMGGFFPFPSQTIYGASKAALKMLTEGLYSELSNTKVKCMVVLPGAISTDILKNSNVEYKTDKDAGSYKMTSAEDTAAQIIKGIEKEKFSLYIGSDSKFMNFIYRLSPKKAINFINKKMG